MAPNMAYELLAQRRILQERRAEVGGWTVGSPHAGRRVLWEAVVRDNDRARRRWLWVACKEGEL